MSHWSERRGVVDDLCYLRQAHLFQKQGLHGIGTDITKETDGYLVRLVTEAAQPDWHSAAASICHVDMAKTGKRVLQYPPGVGALLALFPEGRQVVPLYSAATLAVLAMSLIAIVLARSRRVIFAAAGFGWLALYFMVNPAKASYSIAPTFVLCAIVGFLTAKLFDVEDRRQHWTIAASIGLLLGLSVNFRIANLILCSGYGLFFFIAFVARRDLNSFLRGACFGFSVLVGVMPTLIANAVNAGSPFSTTYGRQDLLPPDFSFSIVALYIRDIQGILVIAIILWLIALSYSRRPRRLWPVAAIVAINLAVNLGYFLTHPIFTQYYLMPIVMLSLWSLLFGYVLDDRLDRQADVGGQETTSPAKPACAFPQTP